MLLCLVCLPDPVLQPHQGQPECWTYDALAQVFDMSWTLDIWNSSSEEVDDNGELLWMSIVFCRSAWWCYFLCIILLPLFCGWFSFFFSRQCHIDPCHTAQENIIALPDEKLPVLFDFVVVSASLVILSKRWCRQLILVNLSWCFLSCSLLLFRFFVSS